MASHRNRREVEREIVELGGTVENLPGTGARMYRHPLMGPTVRVNGRRKDSTRRTNCWLRRLKQRLLS